MAKKNLNIPVGISNFKKMIENNYYYVDKSLFIKDIVDSAVSVTLIPRPRRFGKTLNLSMLQYFFEKTETPYANLFKNLAVAKHPSIMKHQGQYPVIFLTFKDVKATNWEDSYNKMIENIVMQELDKNEDYVWSLLLFSGYLTFKDLRLIEGQFIGDLIFPNKEVISIFRNTVISWFKQEKPVWEQYQKMLSSLTGGDITLFKKQFSSIAVNCLSYFDTSGDEPEKFYHALVLGMLVSLQDNYIIKSNKESGFGRYDVMLIPIDKKKNGIIIEFKKIDHDEEKTLEITAQKAIDQIEEKAYDSELRAMGIKNIIKLAIVFDGKKTLIKEA